MPWIKVIEEKDASRDLSKVYKEIKTKRGKLSNIMKIHSLNPDAMKSHMNLYLALMFGQSNISREEREIIAVVVSSANNCHYCIKHHVEALNHYWKNDEKVSNLAIDFKSVDLSKRIERILNYVYKLTKTPYNISKEDIDDLKDNGLADADILDINLMAGYFNFVNRIALGLGVDFSEDEISGYNY